ncbi:hypothetical protein [Methylobacterium planeticum]|nr:hypothetical protein [Methylobacterium planeticum]
MALTLGITDWPAHAVDHRRIVGAMRLQGTRDQEHPPGASIFEILFR